MYTATMEYRFKEPDFDEACRIWQRHVIAAARNQPGFLRMQFLVNCPSALAIGTWLNKCDAENFMQTGVFKRLMGDLEVLCQNPPQPRTWDLLYFEEA